ncbi:DUF2779 domain-containing protein [Thermomonas sp.]|uniref:DUF2779 domain-containing protein n=1 Tax=Thermomonas sp. TaxID=1971895 RepID=UPI0025F4B65B|nr:DUF2779 domain-containing protein [Thermomonas sp.]
MRPYLSKSRFQSGRQCHKRLWLEVHHRNLIERNKNDQARFADGNLFGELARVLLGSGDLVMADHRDFEQALAQTRDLLRQPLDANHLIYEAAFEREGVRIRADAFLKRPLAWFSLIEVKSSTEVKPEHLWDCAVQAWVARGSGMEESLDEITLAHVNDRFVYTREGDYEGLLQQANVTGDVVALEADVPGIVAELHDVMVGPQPQIATGVHCKKPYECPFLAHCRASEPQPAEYPVELLPHAGKLTAQLAAEGFRDLREVPLDRLPTEKQRRIAEATRSGSPYASPELAGKLDAIGWPRHYLDFETIAFVVPRWLGTRPWQQIPFQFSCHTEQSDDSIFHSHFLDLSGDSPMAGFVKTLRAAVGDSGPILVWNQSFEAGRLHDMADLFPAQAGALRDIIDRMIDLLPIFREHYYHPAMRGSWSIKRVLPTIAPELDYRDLLIGNGGDAQQGYLRAIAPDTPAAEKAKLRQQLLDYCERDTEAMLRLARWRPG